MSSPLHNWIRKRLRNYRETINCVDSRKPVRLERPQRVAVVGAGLAGIGAATTLAERGFDVTLYDKNSYLGGKVGSWEVRFEDGFTTFLDHGFHAFFRHYYNLRNFLAKIGSTRYLEAIEDYLILNRSGQSFSFAEVATTPLLNILSLGRHGFFKFREVLREPRTREIGELLRYECERTFRRFDDVSFEEFARRTGLPPSLQLVFHTFARAFFAPAEQMSMAELMKSFHFFYLSNDCGLLYDYFNQNYHEALLQPVRRQLERHGVACELGRPVEAIGYDGDFEIAHRRFEYLVLATDVVGARNIAMRSGWLRDRACDTYRRLVALQSSNGYAVYRLWLDRGLEKDFPVFVITEKDRILDSVTFYHTFDAAASQWASATGGGVYELHSYAIPKDISDEEEMKRLFRNELYEYLPELSAAKVRYEHLQCRKDFTAFHVGLYADRPAYRTELDNLYLAGDWVKIPTPAMLMEAAFTSGLLCANDILNRNHLQEEPVFSVARKGLFA